MMLSNRILEGLKDIIIGNLMDITDEVKEWVYENFNPEEIYDHARLELWAEENGYVKSEK